MLIMEIMWWTNTKIDKKKIGGEGIQNHTKYPYIREMISTLKESFHIGVPAMTFFATTMRGLVIALYTRSNLLNHIIVKLIYKCIIQVTYCMLIFTSLVDINDMIVRYLV